MSKRRKKARNSSEPSLLELFAMVVVMLTTATVLVMGALVNGF